MALFHLPHTGESGFHRVALELPGLVAGDGARHVGPGSDEAHVAAHDVHELGQLVERPAPEDRPDAGMARVVVRRVPGSPLFRERHDGFGDAPVGLHRAELQDHEGPAPLAQSRLPQQHRPAEAGTHHRRDRELHRRRQREQQSAEAEIEHAFAAPDVPTPPIRRAHPTHDTTARSNANASARSTPTCVPR